MYIDIFGLHNVELGKTGGNFPKAQKSLQDSELMLCCVDFFGPKLHSLRS